MKFFLTLPLSVVLVAAGPHNDAKKVIITTDKYHDHKVIYESKYDIVDITVAFNPAYDSDSSNSIEDLQKQLLIFFIEADIEDGVLVDKGVYVYEDGKVTKVMDSGSAVAASDQSLYVFIGAKDGLHVYDLTTGKTHKYFNYDYSIKDMATEMNTSTIYVLTEERVLYKLKLNYSDTVKEEVDNIKNPEQIMMDYSNNLYFYGDDKKPYVRVVDGEIKEFEGVPQGADVRFFRPPALSDEGMLFLADNQMYTLYPDGKSEIANFTFMPDAKPTAFSMEAVYFHYYGYKKKIYEYDFVSILDFYELDEN